MDRIQMMISWKKKKQKNIGLKSENFDLVYIYIYIFKVIIFPIINKH